MSAISPNREQIAALAADETDRPVVMVNLLKYKAGEGQEQYERYGDVARTKIAETGGRIIYAGRCDQVLVGEKGDWDAVAIVEYPSRKAFLEMVSQPDYRESLSHREAGLERTVVLATTPTQAERRER